MLFTEPTFLFAFLPLLLAVYYVTPLAARNALLVVASVLFYARDGGAFTWLILASIAVNTVAAVWVDRLRGTPAATRLLIAIVGLNLLSLATFKYSGFLVDNLNVGLAAIGRGPLSAPELLLPIGISFFTFHSISYIVDVYRRQAVAQKGPVGAALYLLFFPQLIAGPIIRYKDIAAQINARPHTASGFALGVRRFIIGLAKKLLVAGIVARPADAIFALPPGELTMAHAWLGVACYTLQIYFDFSGYSDMAIGLGHMFGFTFPENFRYPYVASSVQDFWKRWHISLSSWFRDYLYVPLGGNRVDPWKMYRNLDTVFFLCGLWHGASWNFVIWGLFHGTFLVLERVGLGTLLKRLAPSARHVYLLVVVMVGWVFFRAEDLPRALAYLQAMFGLGDAPMPALRLSWYLTREVRLAILAGIIGSMPVIPYLRALAERAADNWRGWATEAAGTVALLAVFLAALLQVAARSYNPFIYFRF